MTTYTYLACDLVTNAILDELPLTGVTFSKVLNGAGSISGFLPMAGFSALKRASLQAASVPRRTALYVDRNGTLVWGGIVWTRRSSGSQRGFNLSGLDFVSYLRRRVLPKGYLYNGTSSMAGIAVSQIAVAQAEAGGNIGLSVVQQGGVGTKPVIRADPWELKNLGTLIDTFAKSNDGFDYALDVAYDNSGNPTKTLTIAYPTMGATVSQTGWVFEYPGSNVIDYTHDEDGTGGDTRWYVLGAGDNRGKVIGSSANTAMIDAGWPLTDGIDQQSSITDPNLIGLMAYADAAIRSPNADAWGLIVKPDGDPPFGAYHVGDDVRLVVNDEMHSVDTFQRIVQMAITPGDGDQTETVGLTLAAAL